MNNSGFESWIIILIIISTVLTCWSFSLLLRLLSEYVARRRKRLHAEHRRRGVIYALIAMLLGFGGALGSGWFALDFARTIGEDDFGDGGVVAAVSLGLVLFSLMLVVWALIGDRARGRLRCPKCWYDMTGIHDPRCPECGKDIKSPKHLRKSRRMRWPFALASVCIGIAVYGFASAQRVDQSDYFALMPTWVLMMGWEHLPEDWILWENSNYESTLQNRLYSRWNYNDIWVSEAATKRFGKRLLFGLTKSAETRWDTRRLDLIQVINESVTMQERVDADGNVESIWIGSPIDSEQLLINSAQDLIDALLAEEPTMLQLKILDGFEYSYWSSSTPYQLAKSWIRSDLPTTIYADFDMETIAHLDAWDRSRFIFNFTERVIMERTAVLLSPLLEQFDHTLFTQGLISDDDVINEITQLITLDTGLIHTQFYRYLDTNTPPGTIDLNSRVMTLGDCVSSMSDKSRTKVHIELASLMNSTDPIRRGHAFAAFFMVQGICDFDDRNEDPAYLACIEHTMKLAINHHTRVYPDRATLHEVGLSIISKHDTSGRVSYPLILRELLGDPSLAPDLSIREDQFGPTAHIEAWVENFAQLADSHDPIVCEWLISNLPVQLGSEYDEVLDSIALVFLNSGDEDLMQRATNKLNLRMAGHLVSPVSEYSDSINIDDDW